MAYHRKKTRYGSDEISRTRFKNYKTFRSLVFKKFFDRRRTCIFLIKSRGRWRKVEFLRALGEVYDRRRFLVRIFSRGGMFDRHYVFYIYSKRY